MSEEEFKPFYYAFGAATIERLNKTLNKKALEGYKVQSVNPYQGPGGTVFVGIMYHSDSKVTSIAMDFVNLDIDKNTEDGTILIRRFTDTGEWKPVGVYSKHVTLARIKPPQKEEK